MSDVSKALLRAHTFCTHPLAIAGKLTLQMVQESRHCGINDEKPSLHPYNAVYQVTECENILTILGASLGYFASFCSLALVVLILIMSPSCCGERRLTYDERRVMYDID